MSDAAFEAAKKTCARFVELVVEWNARVNLIGDPSAADEILLADAAVLSGEGWIPTGARVLDVGSGAGSPAIPLALLRPDLDITMVEPLTKRSAFLNFAIGTVGLAGRARVRSERFDAKKHNGFDVAISRATFAPADWLAFGKQAAPVVIVFAREDEVGVAETPTQSHRYALPTSGAPRMLLRYG